MHRGYRESPGNPSPGRLDEWRSGWHLDHGVSLHPRHWLATAQARGLDRATAQSAVEKLTASTPRVIADVETLVPDDFPASVSDPILQGLDATAQRVVS